MSGEHRPCRDTVPDAGVTSYPAGPEAHAAFECPLPYRSYGHCHRYFHKKYQSIQNLSHLWTGG